MLDHCHLHDESQKKCEVVKLPTLTLYDIIQYTIRLYMSNAFLYTLLERFNELLITESVIRFSRFSHH